MEIDQRSEWQKERQREKEDRLTKKDRRMDEIDMWWHVCHLVSTQRAYHSNLLSFNLFSSPFLRTLFVLSKKCKKSANVLWIGGRWNKTTTTTTKMMGIFSIMKFKHYIPLPSAESLASDASLTFLRWAFRLDGGGLSTDTGTIPSMVPLPPSAALPLCIFNRTKHNSGEPPQLGSIISTCWPLVTDTSFVPGVAI